MNKLRFQALVDMDPGWLCKANCLKRFEQRREFIAPKDVSHT